MFWFIKYSFRQRGGRNKQCFIGFLFAQTIWIFLFSVLCRFELNSAIFMTVFILMGRIHTGAGYHRLSYSDVGFVTTNWAKK